MDSFDYLQNFQFVEDLYQTYLSDKNAVDVSWQKFFEGFEFARKNYLVKPSSGYVEKEFKVINLINAYRQRGHFFTTTNPVRQRRSYNPTLDIENFGLEKADLNTTFEAGKEIGIGKAKLSDIIAKLKQTYCQSIGVEFMYIRQPEVVEWLTRKMEGAWNTPNFTVEKKYEIFQNLLHAVGFESFIHKKFVGQKRFSLEGAESMLPAIHAVIEKGSELNAEEFIIGMSHRGRLNVLANILQKPESHIFKEFIGKEYDEDQLMGDVKYHLGYEKEIHTSNGRAAKLKLVPNPSHLETVTAVTEGISRATLFHQYAEDYNKLVPVVIHGDAAVAAQGIVYEVIQMSQLAGFKTGGTIHLIINNQVGFTTNYTEARSSTYATDIGKVIRAPIFHVNGDDPEALVFAVELAMEYRQEFHTDVFIDLLCYRKYGHNEGDEPRFTQPLLYKAIANHPNPFQVYSSQLLSEKAISKEKIQEDEEKYNQHLENALQEARVNDIVHVEHFLKDRWKNIETPSTEIIFGQVDTTVNKEILVGLARKMTTLPEGKKFFKKIEKLMEDRWNMVQNNNLDWAMCELLAYASLVSQGAPVRISGQDSERGTFSHRHATLVIEDTDQKYTYLKYISDKQASFHVINSLLSEYGVLGFEYGYAMAVPKGLNIWEAQFGDFANVAQVIFDQYISSAYEKWGLMSGLAIMLPHGFEGQGPEHSSARIERYLTLCANNHMQVVNCTTPANLFHVLRRQVVRNTRLPLIIFTPKSLLRHPECVSTLADLTDSGFKEIIDDTVPVSDVKQVLFCSGKIYYELNAKRRELNNSDTAIIRMEQLYPINYNEIEKLKKKYAFAERWVWIQEEPANMGAWPFMSQNLDIPGLQVICRPPSGSPAEGLHEQHILRQRKITEKAFRLCECDNVLTYCGMKCSI